MNENEKGKNQIAYAYQKRWERVVKIKPKIYEQILETQVVWGDKLKDVYDKIFKLEFKVYLEFGKFIEAKNGSSYEKEKWDSKLIYDLFDDNNDAFRKAFNPLLKQIEEVLKPKLKL